MLFSPRYWYSTLHCPILREGPFGACAPYPTTRRFGDADGRNGQVGDARLLLNPAAALGIKHQWSAVARKAEAIGNGRDPIRPRGGRNEVTGYRDSQLKAPGCAQGHSPVATTAFPPWPGAAVVGPSFPALTVCQALAASRLPREVTYRSSLADYGVPCGDGKCSPRLLMSLGHDASSSSTPMLAMGLLFCRRSRHRLQPRPHFGCQPEATVCDLVPALRFSPGELAWALSCRFDSGGRSAVNARKTADGMPGAKRN